MKPDVMCCAIFRDIHKSWIWKAEPRLLSPLPQEAVSPAWPSLEASSWVWRLLEPGAPGSYSCYLSLSVKHTQIHKHWNALLGNHTKVQFAHVCPNMCVYVRTYCHTGPQTICVLHSHQTQSQSIHRPVTFMCFFCPQRPDDVIGKWCHLSVQRALTAVQGPNDTSVQTERSDHK